MKWLQDDGASTFAKRASRKTKTNKKDDERITSIAIQQKFTTQGPRVCVCYCCRCCWLGAWRVTTDRCNVIACRRGTLMKVPSHPTTLCTWYTVHALPLTAERSLPMLFIVQQYKYTLSSHRTHAANREFCLVKNSTAASSFFFLGGLAPFFARGISSIHPTTRHTTKATKPFFPFFFGCLIKKKNAFFNNFSFPSRIDFHCTRTKQCTGSCI